MVRATMVALVFSTLNVACVTTSGTASPATLTSLSQPHDEPELFVPAVQTQQARPQHRHRVEPGQTLYRIARSYEVSVDDLMDANGISDPRTLAVGRVLIIPGAVNARQIAPPGAQEAPEAVAAAKGGAEVKQPPRSRPLLRGAKQALVMPKGAGVLAWPLRGVIYARFGKKGTERHDGIDLAAPLATPVKTAKAGTVVYAGEQKGYGLIAIIDHGDDLITLYAHNRDLRVKTGQRVRDGQVVATVGESGRTSGPHLHFEVRQGGVPVDPLQLLGAPPGKATVQGRRPR